MNSPVMSSAGVWEEWPSPEGEKVLSFSVVTTGSNSLMAKIHDRMPVILDDAEQVKWLDPKANDPEELSLLVKSCPSKFLACHEVSKGVNSPKKNSTEVLKQVGIFSPALQLTDFLINREPLIVSEKPHGTLGYF